MKPILKFIAVGLALIQPIAGEASKADTPSSKDATLSKPPKAEQITNSNAPWHYEALAKLPTSERKLAGFLSVDYKNAKDEFEKEELFAKIKPLIAEKIGEAKKQKLVKVVIGVRLENYDFESHGFPTGIHDGTFILFGDYALKFDPIEGMGIIHMPLAEAKKLQITLRKSRQARIEIVGSIGYCEESNINRIRAKTLFLETHSMHLYLGKSKKSVAVETLMEVPSSKQESER